VADSAAYEAAVASPAELWLYKPAVWSTR